MSLDDLALCDVAGTERTMLLDTKLVPYIDLRRRAYLSGSYTRPVDIYREIVAQPRQTVGSLYFGDGYTYTICFHCEVICCGAVCGKKSLWVCKVVVEGAGPIEGDLLVRGDAGYE